MSFLPHGIQRWADPEAEPNEELSIAVKIAKPDGNSARNEILTFWICELREIMGDRAVL